jgi:hypothetical protein
MLERTVLTKRNRNVTPQGRLPGDQAIASASRRLRRRSPRLCGLLGHGGVVDLGPRRWDGPVLCFEGYVLCF